MSRVIWQVMQEIESGYKYRWSFFCLPVTYLLVVRPGLHHLSQTSPWPGDWGPLFHKTSNRIPHVSSYHRPSVVSRSPESPLPFCWVSSDPYCFAWGLGLCLRQSQWALLLGNSVVLVPSSVQELLLSLSSCTGAPWRVLKQACMGVPESFWMGSVLTELLASWQVWMALAIGHRPRQGQRAEKNPIRSQEIYSSSSGWH